MRFTCEMFHPNIYPDGRVCISILHAPGDDPMGYESSAERWSPVQSVEKILLSVVSMLAEPNDESGANVDASKMWREDREQFNKIARQTMCRSRWDCDEIRQYCTPRTRILSYYYLTDTVTYSSPFWDHHIFRI
ncbi:unnamed protein product, partial [Ranitomeya imitator]